jgi:hypothetical protein
VGRTELVVGAQDADVFFLVAEEDVDLFCSRVLGLASRGIILRERACVLSTMSSSIADVKKACGGRSTGRTCCGGGPRAPPSTFGPCCGGGVALYTPPYPASARQSSCPSAPLEVLATSPIEDDGRCGASTPSSC